jgi:hypothetical protein
VNEAAPDDTQTSATTDAPPATLTGEWGGARTALRNKGVDLFAGYTSEAASNLTGGTRRMTTETAQLAFGTTIDTEKLLGLKGARFRPPSPSGAATIWSPMPGSAPCSSLRRSMAMARPPA